jgi:hypothetical protein
LVVAHGTGVGAASGTTSVETASHVRASLSVVGALLSLHVHDQLLDQGEDLGSVDHVQVKGTLILGLFVVLVISLISDFFLLHLSQFLDFVMVDVQLFAFEG